MKRYGRGTISEFLSDNVVYRNLVPVDPGLPSLAELWEPLGLLPGQIPRKSSPEYARVMTHLLELTRKRDIVNSRIERIIYVGDTRLNDSTAFLNICQAGNWPGMAFIGAERDEPFHFEIEEGDIGTLFLANRWRALHEFRRFCHNQDFHIDERTAVLLDLDKTALGARGRNDHVIDQVRIEAAIQTVSDLLGDDYDPESFGAAYQNLNQSEFHAFTTDNQDYLVYICLIIASGLFDLDSLVADVRSEKLASFEQFITDVDRHVTRLPANLRTIHEDVFFRVQQGDPTPFKAFRYAEYSATAARMGQLDEKTPLGELLSQEIVITQEVREAAIDWREQGALLFGLSDKPDEASIPTAKLASQGYKPIHQIETEIVGA